MEIGYGEWFKMANSADRSKQKSARKIKINGFYGRLIEIQGQAKPYRAMNGRTYKSLEAALKAVA